MPRPHTAYGAPRDSTPRRARLLVWAVVLVAAFRIRIDDSGTNGVRGDSDDRIFATQGIYVP